MHSNGYEETERRQARRGAMTFDQVLDAFAHSKEEHVLGSRSTEAELLRLEEALGSTLPPSFRVFLRRLGGGLFFRGHEIFGTRRVMIHDIELVPDILTVCRTLEAQAVEIPERTIPFHRARGTIHFMPLDGAESAGPIVSIPPAEPCPSFESFLEIVVLPRLATPRP